MYEIIAASIAAAVITYELNVKRKLGSVIASAAVGLFFGAVYAALGSAGFVEKDLAETIPLAAMGASFAGMSSKEVMPGHGWIALSGAVFSFIFLFSSPVFSGIGGGLGISACISVVITRGAILFFGKPRR